jgi:hypothetical protein
MTDTAYALREIASILKSRGGWDDGTRNPSEIRRIRDIANGAIIALAAPAPEPVGRISIERRLAIIAILSKRVWNNRVEGYIDQIADEILATLSPHKPAAGVSDPAQLSAVLGAFYKTLDVMKSARRSDSKKMSVWVEDMKAAEDVVRLLEGLRDATPAVVDREAVIEGGKSDV